jgi:hypothetical protein
MRNQFGNIAIGCVLAVAGMPSAAYPPRSGAPERLGGGRVAHLHDHCDGNHSQPFGSAGVEALGNYCDVSDCLQIPAGCKITSGADGEVDPLRNGYFAPPQNLLGNLFCFKIRGW